jgi:hypothetical protein
MVNSQGLSDLDTSAFFVDETFETSNDSTATQLKQSHTYSIYNTIVTDYNACEHVATVSLKHTYSWGRTIIMFSKRFIIAMFKIR